MHSELTWHTLTGADLPAIAALAGRCLTTDGGLPLSTAESFLGRRFADPQGVARGAVDADGRLVAAGAVRPQPTQPVTRSVYQGLVDPAYRGRGVGTALLDWGLAEAAARGDAVVVETEALTGAAAALFATRGLRRAFAEDVMRFDLADTPLPEVTLPAGTRLEPWSEPVARRFFAVYEASFADRPGFPGWPARRWIDWTTDDEDFRPDWSLLATDPAGTDLAFVTCAEGWIVQVGVRPQQRGRRLGAALVTEALRRMRTDGGTGVLLDVNVDNPAGRLYQRLGFAVIGRRARFEPCDRQGAAGD